eukprot:364187-Chlamydomonas_euryale.AAC.12
MPACWAKHADGAPGGMPERCAKHADAGACPRTGQSMQTGGGMPERWAKHAGTGECLTVGASMLHAANNGARDGTWKAARLCLHNASSSTTPVHPPTRPFLYTRTSCMQQAIPRGRGPARCRLTCLSSFLSKRLTVLSGLVMYAAMERAFCTVSRTDSSARRSSST